MAVSESKTCHREYLGLNLNVQTVHKSLESQFFVVHNKIQSGNLTSNLDLKTCLKGKI